MNPAHVLILPGWKNSGPDHWQTLWEAADGYTRVEQHSWLHPLRGDWTARLEDVVLACEEPAVLVAHSLGCILVAAWASHSRNIHRVKGALLAAPPDVERDDVRDMLPSWAPVPMTRFPFESVVFASSDDPFCTAQRARQFASAWGSSCVDAGPHGHLNAESALADWPEAYLRLLQLKELTSPAIIPSPGTTPTP
jgi:predicted alpha/beta hydrolase family esterase